MTVSGNAYETTQDGLRAVLEDLGIQLRYNPRARRVEYLAGQPSVPQYARWQRTEGWMPWDDLISALVKNTIHDHYLMPRAGKGSTGIARWNVGAGRWQEMVLGLAAEAPCDPFLEWVNSLPAWDGVERVEPLLSDVLRAEDSPLTRWAGRYLLVGPIKRAIEPGADLPVIPVLLSPEDTAQGRLLRSLLPQSAWYGDAAFNSAASVKEQAEMTAGKVVVEVSTMAALNDLKTFLSRTEDGYRASYARSAEQHPRRFVLIATVNGGDDAHVDARGGGRFVMVRVGEGEGDVEAIVAETREQLWAEALSRVESGEWADILPSRDILPPPPKTLEEELASVDWDEPLPAYEVARRIGRGMPPQDLAYGGRLARALRAAGWTRTEHPQRYDNIRTRLWVPPGSQEAAGGQD